MSISNDKKLYKSSLKLVSKDQVKKIVDLKLKGWTGKQIANWLNEAGETRKNKKKFSQSFISKILISKGFRHHAKNSAKKSIRTLPKKGYVKIVLDSRKSMPDLDISGSNQFENFVKVQKTLNKLRDLS